MYCHHYNTGNSVECRLLPVKAELSVSELTILHSERPKLYTILVFLSAIGLIQPKLVNKWKTNKTD